MGYIIKRRFEIRFYCVRSQCISIDYEMDMFCIGFTAFTRARYPESLSSMPGAPSLHGLTLFQKSPLSKIFWTSLKTSSLFVVYFRLWQNRNSSLKSPSLMYPTKTSSWAQLVTTLTIQLDCKLIQWCPAYFIYYFLLNIAYDIINSSLNSVVWERHTTSLLFPSISNEATNDVLTTRQYKLLCNCVRIFFFGDLQCNRIRNAKNSLILFVNMDTIILTNALQSYFFLL